MPKFPRRLVFFLIGCLFFAVFVFFSFLVKEDLLTQFDFNTTVRLQDNIPRRFDTFFSYFSVFGSFEVTTIVLIILLIIRRKIDGFFVFFGFGMFMVIELFGKILVDHPGPPFLFARYESLVNFPTHYIPHPTGAYPSGHSGRTVFLAVVLLYMLFQGKKPITPVKLGITGGIIGFTLIMLVSRVYLGEHWTTDVIGGTLLALALACMTLSVLDFRKKRQAQEQYNSK